MQKTFLIMAEFNRIFKKSTLLNIAEGNGWGGSLELDKPDFRVLSWTVNAQTKILTVEVLFTADQGSINQKHSRSYEVDLTKIPVGARQRFINQYNFITDNLIKVIPELSDGVEQ